MHKQINNNMEVSLMSNSLHKRQKILASILLFVYLVGLIKLPVSANPPNDLAG